MTDRPLPFWAIAVGMGMAYFLIQVDWSISSKLLYQNSVHAQSSIVAAGNRIHAAGYALAGLFGGMLLVWPGSAPRSYKRVPLALFFAYAGLCVASVMWSAAPELTLRRLLIILFCTIAVIGTARHIDHMELIKSVVIIGLMFMAMGVAIELLQHTFKPWRCDYRFAGAMHPNVQGAVCTTLVLAAYVGFRNESSKRIVFISIAILGFIFLIFTKSRSSMAGCLAALYLVSFWGSSHRTKQMLALIPVVVAGAIVSLALIADMGILEILKKIIAMGRCPEAALQSMGEPSGTITLTGRLPLWNMLLDYVAHRPWLGYGYHGFWTPEMITTISNHSGWTVPHGHSVAMDVLLNVGIVGAMFYFLLILSVGIRVIQLCRCHGNSSSLLAYAMLVFFLVAGQVESSYMEPRTFYVFVTSLLFVNACVRREGEARWH